MKLYHTGREEIREPDLRRGRKNADFGQGFYLTPDREFARRWAGQDAMVNEYELDTDGLRIHHFERSEDWFRYILDNRRAVDGLEVDLVIGPIANDTIFETLGIIGSGFLTPATRRAPAAAWRPAAASSTSIPTAARSPAPSPRIRT